MLRLHNYFTALAWDRVVWMPQTGKSGVWSPQVGCILQARRLWQPTMAYDRKDHFYKRAKREGKASRAVYKLSELQRRYKLVRAGAVAVDLGCAPGGWMQELSQMVGPKGRVVGIDLLPLKIQVPPNCAFILGDITDEVALAKVRELAGGSVDAILSDMAPNLSGVAFADAYRSYELAMCALDVCGRLLKESGNFVVKIFPGEEFASFVAELKRSFREVATIVPEATRKTSSERYLVATGFRAKR
jgi:23S rRNA (uridine2552-2'-O)-methyltransferase